MLAFNNDLFTFHGFSYLRIETKLLDVTKYHPPPPGWASPTAITTSPCGLHQSCLPHPLTCQGPPIWRPLPRTVFCLMPAIPSDPRPVVPSKRNPSPQSHPHSHNSSDSVLYLSFATELTTRFNGTFVIA